MQNYMEAITELLNSLLQLISHLFRVASHRYSFWVNVGERHHAMGPSWCMAMLLAYSWLPAT